MNDEESPPPEPEAVEIPPNSSLFVRISAAQNGQAEDLMAYHWKTLIDNCSFTFVDQTNGLHLRRAVKTFYEEDVMESEALLNYYSPHGPNTMSLPELGQKLVISWCNEQGYGLHDQPRLEVLNPHAYILKCTQVHPRIALDGFSLGNFLNFGTFIEHYCLDMKDRIRDSRNLIEKGEMDILFEHDFKKMVIRFTLGEFSPAKDRMVWHLYRMTLDYQGVHSVVVDYSENGRICLFLKLKYVPKIVVDEPKNQNDLQNRREIRLYSKHSHNFFRVNEVQNWGRRLGRSSALKLIYPIHGRMDAQKSEAMVDFWEILSRLKFRAKVHVYFCSIKTVPGTEQEEDWISYDLFANFSSYYLLRALLSRGYAVQDQIDHKFVQIVARASHQNAEATEKALELLLTAVDEHRYFSLLNAFSKIYKEFIMRSDRIDAQMLGEADETEVPRNCVRVRKLIVTPTRELLMPPEVMMSNRVLRRFGHDYALRLLFRDEDGQKLRADRLQEDLFTMLVRDVLLNGRQLGDRRYQFLAWSNSQLRDHGCYMFCKTADGDEVPQIRRWMGDFTACSNVPKYMSRMGQCFTQAQEVVRISFSSQLVKLESDITGGELDQYTNEPYIFSDGIGRISEALAKKVCEQLELDQPTPSAYQIRYAGCKGMLSIDKRLDKNQQGPQLILRDSMKKFDSDQSCVLEVVKYSQPSPVYLNRPLIMILDQVSCKHGAATFQRVTNTIHKLLEKELYTMADMLLSETASVEALHSRTPLGIKFKPLRESGFSLTTEPFFRGLLLAIHYYTLKAQLFKAKIEIPTNQGRTMYGVLDETGVLQYGQVFVQYSQDVKNPGVNKKILKGKIMVTKNPCIVPGDVRLFTAVDKASLRHLHDVIVFPKNGPRPHTDEMAGSDLDGDEYAVYWNLSLMFDRNEEAMHFPKLKPDPIPGGVKDQDMVDFFQKYLRQDCVGRVSIAHLVCADRFGIFEPTCMSIAEKCSMAVDFPKTGKQADRLTEDETPYKYPDFMQKEHQPMYRSKRLLGQLFRKIKAVADTVELGRNETMHRDLYDVDLNYPGWEAYRDVAVVARDQYVHHLQHIMDQYGIQDESQLVSGHMVSIRNRISDGEKEDFSFFNTEKLVELRIHKIFDKFRREFFDDFGGEREDLLQSPTTEVQQKASAYYMVTYGDYESGTIRMLSFPWLVHEILGYIKRQRNFERQCDDFLIEPIHDKLEKAIEIFNLRQETHEDRISMIKQVLTKLPELQYPLWGYGVPLAHVLYVVLRWCREENVFRPRALDIEHVAALFLHFASGGVGQYCESEAESYIATIEELKTAKENERGSRGAVADSKPPHVLYRSGSLALGFVKFLSSQHFLTQKILDFTKISSLLSIFSRRQWSFLQSVAFKTYHHIAWTSNFKSLHIATPIVGAAPALKWDRDELDPVPIQIPHDSPVAYEINSSLEGNRQICKMLEEWSGMDEINMRRDPNNYDQTQYLVVGAGSLEARNKLRDILMADDLEIALCEKKCPENLREE